MIRSVKLSDAKEISDIYNEYVENTMVTFEEETVSAEEIAVRIQKVTDGYPWLVFEEEGSLTGYASAARWKERSAYRHTVETGIYIRTGFTGENRGSLLLENLLAELRLMDIHCVLAGIALPNPASTALFEKYSFEKVAHFKEVGYKFNRWIDVGCWQLLL